MRPPRALAIAGTSLTAAIVLLSGCSSGTSAQGADPGAQTSASVTASASTGSGTLPTAAPLPDPGLPENWPVAIPGYPDGRLLTAVVSEDGKNVNGTWASEASAADAWSTMDARLRSLGYVTAAESGGEDMLVDDETQRSDYFVRDGYEVNLVVIPGDQTTVQVNGSAL